ncbi:MAG TPA: hypothetical protein VFX97_08220 [Pyrinomonadaceae bacterium]|nr:hypothetical protein [Pyrinomonadaceae bacterium]
MKSIIAATLFIVTCSLSAFSQGDSRTELLKELETKRAELGKLELRVLEPATEDREAYAQFLAQPDTGLMRLLPREKYDSHANGKSGLTIRGGGSYYSFTRQSNEYGRATDLGLQQGNLSVGFAGADYGMLIKLEGANLEDVSTELPGITFLAKYAAVSSEPDARIEQRRFGSAGTVIEGISYKGNLRPEVGATYVLRSIAFEASDVLVAFKVVRQDTDGSLIIAWKLLKKYPKPELNRNTASR